MLTKILLLAFVTVSLGFSQDNFNGYKDTSNISGFRADSLKYSKVYELSKWENVRIDVMANDTATANLSADSTKFYWWIETGHPCLNASNQLDTFWTKVDPLVIDTFDITTAGNRAITYRLLGTDGTYNGPSKTIDTATVSGFAVQSRAFTAEWDVWARIGHKGMTGNKTTTYIKLRDNMVRRAFIGTRNK
jgi:hypothetical protein